MQGINAEPLTIGGNKVTIKAPPYCHTLSSNNQRVKYKYGKCGIKLEKNTHVILQDTDIAQSANSSSSIS